jgi:hypothetical protein
MCHYLDSQLAFRPGIATQHAVRYSIRITAYQCMTWTLGRQCSRVRSLGIARLVVIVAWHIVETTTVPFYYLAKPQPRERTDLAESAGKEDPVELDSSLTT